MINKMQKMLSYKLIPLMVLGILYFVMFYIKPLFGDDTGIFTKALTEYSVVEYWVYRYQTWSSRNIIETILAIVVNIKWLWALISAFCCVLICYSIIQICNIKKIGEVCFLVVVFCCYPMMHMDSAGWVATTVNYLWVASFGLYALLPVKKILCNEVITNRLEMCSYVLATIFAANQEQMAAIFLGFFILTIGLSLSKRRYNKLLILQFILALISIIYHLICPGNQIRKEYEVLSWFAEYNSMTTVGKIELGFSATMYSLVVEFNVLWIGLCIAILIRNLQRRENKFLMKVSAVPLIVTLILIGPWEFLKTRFIYLDDMVNAMTQSGIQMEGSILKRMLPYFILGCIILSVGISIYYCFDNKRKAIFNIIILLSGLFSRMIMGFSPTIWASSERTFIFLYIAIIVVCMNIYMEIMKDENCKYVGALEMYMYICACLTFWEF